MAPKTKTAAPKAAAPKAAAAKEHSFSSKYQARVPTGGVPYPVITATTRGKFRVRVPGGFDGEMASLEGCVITMDHPFPHYWSQPFGDGEATAPDCMSIDGITGHGNPGGPCMQCPHRADYSCKGYHAVYLDFIAGFKARTAQGEIEILPPHKPIILRVPATSRPNLNAFIQDVGGDPREVEVVCTIGSTDTKTRKGIVAVEFTPGRKVPSKERPAIEAVWADLQGKETSLLPAGAATPKALPPGKGGAARAADHGWG